MYANPHVNICIPLIPLALVLDMYFGIPAPEILTVFVWVSTGLVWLIWKSALKDRSKKKTNEYWIKYWRK
jgi:hypothetical protein